ncbi:LacI family transcriptional regulator [Paenibacillus doosanensis]|uniref:HTH-type transcriptional regulator DegA n=1 Tax=Paenibacillus konkukensis TaxID=2020716 RepID=A0ABY4RXW9_9BACL|nr:MULTISPECIES: LacI family DNA-binding transcriptional regulator [Paenibacillus]MCS7460206.1 LacI family transcriptional regulator [Paenibacillus doosanensis]UQZ86249.1 HTH-type transcriptional regulator DegA [Paenibacillus konkukensis]
MSKHRSVTIVDIAEAAGVSIATVSNVLNRRKVPMAEETIRKVEKAAEELGYRRNVMAASLSRKKSYELGLIVPGFIGYYGLFAEVMERTAHRFGYHMSVFSAGGYDPDMEKRHLDVLLQRRVDGLFCHGLAMSTDTTRHIVSDGTPLVLFNGWNWPQDIAAGAVNLDFAGGCLEAVRHLVRQGCRSLFYLGRSRAHETNKQRLKGFRQGAAEAGDGIRSYVLEADPQPMAELVRMTREMSGDGPVGILAFDDLVALRFMSAAIEQGLRVPEEYKIFGINNDVVSHSCYPQITTLDIPYSQQARLAVDLMLRQLGEDEKAGEEHERQALREGHEIRIPLTLIPRLSTAAT